MGRNVFWDLFHRRRVTRVVDHPAFGRLEFAPTLGWSNQAFSFWGFTPVQLLIDASENGPTKEQEEAFRRLVDRQEALLPRLLAAVAEQRADTVRPQGVPVVRTLSVPALGASGPARTGSLWTMWFEYPAEEIWGYGVQSQDDWVTLHAFAED
jgi:hypothetical protein